MKQTLVDKIMEAVREELYLGGAHYDYGCEVQGHEDLEERVKKIISESGEK